MRTKVELICRACGTNFSRLASEFTRNERLGRPTYCSRVCAGRENHKNIPPDSVKWDHLRPNNQWNDYSPFRTSLRIARNRALLVNRECSVTLEDLKALWEKQEGICPYTGWKMVLPSSSHTYNSLPKTPQNASLDRIDSAKGYTVDNVPICQLYGKCRQKRFYA